MLGSSDIAGTFVTGFAGAPPSMICSALPVANGLCIAVMPHGVIGVGARSGRPIVRACQYEPMFGTCSSPSATCRTICLGGVFGSMPVSTLCATPEPSTLSQRIWNRLTASVSSSASG
jgi:hypothetical protein